MRAQVIVRLKHGVLDPQGEAVHRALSSLGFDGVRGVRVCKLIEVDVDDGPPDEVRASVDRMADQLLANPVIESYRVVLRGDEGEDTFHEATNPYIKPSASGGGDQG